MTLGFSQVINKKPNYFVEKIFHSLSKMCGKEMDPFIELCSQRLEYDCKHAFINEVCDQKPKLHTIRIDEHDRWKAGNDIHFVINNRTPKRFQFAPVIKCVSVQTIRISWHGMIVTVYVDGRSLSHDTLNKLAINDGFDSLQGFFAYFNKDFTGKIIHWTDLKY